VRSTPADEIALLSMVVNPAQEEAMNFTHLFVGLVAVGWLISVEYRLWANLRILSEFQARVTKSKEPPSHLRAVEK
jgi:hypothetical protein